MSQRGKTVLLLQARRDFLQMIGNVYQVYKVVDLPVSTVLSQSQTELPVVWENGGILLTLPHELRREQASSDGSALTMQSSKL